MTGRQNIHVWMGECHVHAGIDPENIRLQRSLHPEAEFLIHPECGCSTSVLEAMSAGDVDPDGVQILSTEGMIKRPALSDADEFIVATEVGILHRLRRENPSKRFFAANERASCAYMKVTTLPKVRDALIARSASHHGADGDRRSRAAGDRAHGRDRRRRAAALVAGARRCRSRGIAQRRETRSRSMETPETPRTASAAPCRAPSRRCPACPLSSAMASLRFPLKQDAARRRSSTSALEEDGAFNDITTIATVVSDRRSRATLVARAERRGLRRAARARGVPPARPESRRFASSTKTARASSRASRCSSSPDTRAGCSRPSASR